MHLIIVLLFTILSLGDTATSAPATAATAGPAQWGILMNSFIYSNPNNTQSPPIFNTTIVSMYYNDNKYIDGTFTIYPILINECTGKSYNYTDMKAIVQSTGNKLLVVLDSHCNYPVEDYVADVVNTFYTMSDTIGFIAVSEVGSPVLGYYSSRKGLNAGWKHPSMPTGSIRSEDALVWLAYAQNTPGYQNAHVSYDINLYFIWMMANDSLYVWIDLYGILSLISTVYGIYVLTIYVQKREKKKGGQGGINLMVTVICVDIFGGILRMISAFGCGLNMLEHRFISILALYLTSFMPHILLFANLMATVRSWVKMTEMKNVNPSELTRQLAIYHLTLIAIIVSVDVARSFFLTIFSDSDLFEPVYNGTVFFYLLVMTVGTGTFFQGSYTVRSRMIAAGKLSLQKSKESGNQGGSEVEKFLNRMYFLCTIMGIALILGGCAFLLYAIGFSNTPQLYPYLVMLGMFLFTTAGLVQTVFCAETLMRSVAPKKKTVNATVISGTQGGGKSELSAITTKSTLSTKSELDNKSTRSVRDVSGEK